MNSQQTRHAVVRFKFAADEMPRSFRRNHEHVHRRVRYDFLEVDAEAVGEREVRTVAKIRRDVLLKGGWLQFIGDENHHNVGLLDGVCGFKHFQTSRLRLRAAVTASAQTDDDVSAAVFEVHGMGMTLRTETEYCDFLAT